MTEFGTPRGWLGTVTLEGSDVPVTVTLEHRDGTRVFLRQVDPGEPETTRVPMYDGDEYIVMKAISHISLNQSGEVDDATGLLFGLRIVPVRQDSGVVYARTLRRGEPDTGARVHVRPGDSLVLEAGSVIVEFDYLDEIEPATDSGYVPLTPVLAIWLAIGHENSDKLKMNYLLAAARRLDTVNLLLMDVERRRKELSGQDLAGPAIRRAMFALIGAVEMAIVALGRVVDMMMNARDAIACSIEIPEIVSSSSKALKKIRNAYEHIDDRALGKGAWGKPDSQALTIFDQTQLIAHDRILYGHHSLDLSDEVPRILAATREFFKTAARGE